MRAIAPLALAILCGMLCMSCNFLPSEPYREVHSYDLGVPASAGLPLSVQPFGTDSACKFKLLYRVGGNEMLIDEYNKWTQPPGQMLTKYLRLAFRSESGEAGKLPPQLDCELSGSILAFEADLDAKKVNLGVHYTLSSMKLDSKPGDRTTIFSQPFSTNEPEAIAEAMTKAAAQLVESVKSDAKAIVASDKSEKTAAASK